MRLSLKKRDLAASVENSACVWRIRQVLVWFFPIFTGAKGSVCLNEAPSGISVAPVLQLQLTGIYKTISKTYGHEDLSVNSKLF